jgi:hypothetical protein
MHIYDLEMKKGMFVKKSPTTNQPSVVSRTSKIKKS